jgi:hypothetical protein
VPGDDVVVDADLERLTRLAKAARIEFGKLDNALVHFWSLHGWQEARANASWVGSMPPVIFRPMASDVNRSRP